MFLEHFISGVGSATGYLAVFIVMFVVSWKLGGRIYANMVRSVMQTVMGSMMGPPSGVMPPGLHEIKRVCSACSFQFNVEYKFCPDCGVEILREPTS